MFTGIIETTGKILLLEKEGTNLNLWVGSNLSKELRVDQSVAHNGVCLTVVELGENSHKVTAVEETLSKTNLGNLEIGSLVNIERCMKSDGRFDGHIVQGHVDDTATCTQVEKLDGSWFYHFGLNQKSQQELIVDKGSICINGVSLTVVACTEIGFSVTIIPYTYEHTTFQSLKVGDFVNLEFDILGKYIQKQLAARA
ncbi:MAG: riboflavin synthase [Bacteroidia bacterium]|nr:riboflavin synthase [Bacteroidia bacterium]MCF8426042.1 riboflavin synthase [Bacteroidia bacterium]MCF8445363.1 riboflavin synthase [Bacteroidia bacterium]